LKAKTLNNETSRQILFLMFFQLSGAIYFNTQEANEFVQ